MGSIYQNNGYFYYQTYITLSDGSRSRIQQSLHTKEQSVAEKRKREWDKKVKSGLFKVPRTPILTLIDGFLEDRKRQVKLGHLSPNTLHPDRVSLNSFKKYLEHLGGTFYLDDFEGEGGERILTDFINYRTDQGKSPNTIRREISHVRTFFSTLSKNRNNEFRLHDNPFVSLVKPSPTTRVNVPDPTEWMKIRDHLRQLVKSGEFNTFKWIIHLQFETGCRISEALTLKWNKGKDDIQGMGRSFSYLHDQNRRWTIYFKRRTRTLPIDQMGQKTLSLQKLLKTVEPVEGSEFVFPNPRTGKPYLMNSTPKMFRRLLDELKIKNPLTSHGIRHGFVSYLLNRGISTYQIGQIVGHSESQITELYGHVDLKSIGTALKTLR